MNKIDGSLLVIALALLTGCGDSDKEEFEQVVGGEVVVDFSGSDVKKLLGEDVIENTVVYGYKAYKIPYETEDEEGNNVNVSGLMVVPQGLPDIVYSTWGLSMVSDGHGTIFANREAPSEFAANNNAPEGAALILTSLGGFVTLQADYIGFGDSAGHYHPFVLQKSLANASIDFITAAKVFASNNNINLNGQLFLTGYSEGAYAAMAALKQIELDGDLSVAAAAPMAGPYALELLSTNILQEANLSVPSFVANVGYAYAKAYDENISTIINEPYASKLDRLLNGNYDRTQIDPELTTVTTGEQGLFKTDFVNAVLTDSSHWFRVATQANDLHNWVPTTNIHLLHCQEDEVIPYAISELTHSTMTALGANNVNLVPVETALGLPGEPSLGHADCASLAYAVATDIFAKIRLSTFGY